MIQRTTAHNIAFRMGQSRRSFKNRIASRDWSAGRCTQVYVKKTIFKLGIQTK